MSKVILYTTHCPRCIVLTKKLQAAGIKYEEITDVQTMLDAGLEMAPGLNVNGVVYDFKEAVEWIGEQ